MTDRRRNIFILLLVAGLLAASIAVILTKPTKLGLDLKGGVELIYQGKPTRQAQVTPDSLNRAIDILRMETVKLLVELRGASPVGAESWMRRFSDCRVAEVVNQSKLVYCMNPRASQPKPAWRPKEETPRAFVTVAADPDLATAMDAASYAMIETLEQKKGLTRLDAYSLASLTMDCRLGDLTADTRWVHCLVPKSLWKK